MEALYSQAEKDNKRTSAIITGVVLALLLILMFIPFFQFVEEENISGIMIALGSPDAESFGEDEGAAPTEDVAEESDAAAEAAASEDAPADPTASTEKEVATADDASSSSLDKKKEEQAKADAKAEADRKAKAAAKAEADRKAKELADKKKELSDLLGGGDGNDSSTNGDSDGEPDKNNLSGITTGTGDIGDGFGGRDVVSRPSITDKSQATGKVVVKVCVNAKGDVISAKYTQKGSTATDLGLIKTAEKGVKAYKFSPGTLDKQCGNITVNFKVQ